MEKIFYTADAYISTYAQGTDLLIVKSSDGEMYGASFEFDICTKDIKKVSIRNGETFNESDKRFEDAEWAEFTDEIGTIPASWQEIIASGLSDFISGYQLESEVVVHRFKT